MVLNGVIVTKYLNQSSRELHTDFTDFHLYAVRTTEQFDDAVYLTSPPYAVVDTEVLDIQPLVPQIVQPIVPSAVENIRATPLVPAITMRSVVRFYTHPTEDYFTAAPLSPTGITLTTVVRYATYSASPEDFFTAAPLSPSGIVLTTVAGYITYAPPYVEDNFTAAPLQPTISLVTV